MAYKLRSVEVPAPNGQKRTFFYREDTNDRNTIQALFCEDEYKVCKMNWRRGDVVIDIGAHIGGLPLLLTTLHPGIDIYAYEPILDNFELMKRSLDANEFDNDISINNHAVWFYDEDRVKMYIGDDSENGKVHRFIGSIVRSGKFRNKRRYRWANTITLDRIFKDNGIGECKLLKIDCEGAEYAIFKATSKETLEKINLIVGEYHRTYDKEEHHGRKYLLELTKGVYNDITPGGPSETPSASVGPFIFRRK